MSCVRELIISHAEHVDVRKENRIITEPARVGDTAGQCGAPVGIDRGQSALAFSITADRDYFSASEEFLTFAIPAETQRSRAAPANSEWAAKFAGERKKNVEVGK